MVWLADPHLVPPHVEWQRGHDLQTIEYTASLRASHHEASPSIQWSASKSGCLERLHTRTCLTCDPDAADPFEAALVLLLGSRMTRTWCRTRGALDSETPSDDLSHLMTLH